MRFSGVVRVSMAILTGLKYKFHQTIDRNEATMLTVITLVVLTMSVLGERETPPSYPLWPEGFR